MEPRRYYPKGVLLSHLLGFAGIDSQGLEGVELQYETYLRGQKSMVRFQRDALGRTISLTGSKGRRPPQGYRIVLTIDEVIQYIAEQELESALKYDGRTERGDSGDGPQNRSRVGLGSQAEF